MTENAEHGRTPDRHQPMRWFLSSESSQTDRSGKKATRATASETKAGGRAAKPWIWSVE